MATSGRHWRARVQPLALAVVLLGCVQATGSATCARAFQSGGIPQAHLQGDTVVKRSTFYSTRWGNVLSPYWAARTMAHLGGYKYSGGKFGRGTWMEFLPSEAAPGPTNKNTTAAFKKACECPTFEFIHMCSWGWTDIIPVIAKDTWEAMQRFAKGQPRHLVKQTVWKPSDWLIYDRCCILCHPQQGFASAALYDALPPRGSFTVYSMSPPHADAGEGRHMCTRLHDARDKHIAQHNPSIKVVDLKPAAELWVDFMRLMTAPNVLIPSAGSSWTLWSTIANPGNVITVPFTNRRSLRAKKAYMSHFKVRGDIPVLYDKKVLHLPSHFREEHKQKIVNWFLNTSATSPAPATRPDSGSGSSGPRQHRSGGGSPPSRLVDAGPGQATGHDQGNVEHDRAGEDIPSQQASDSGVDRGNDAAETRQSELPGSWLNVEEDGAAQAGPPEGGDMPHTSPPTTIVNTANETSFSVPPSLMRTSELQFGSRYVKATLGGDSRSGFWEAEHFVIATAFHLVGVCYLVSLSLKFCLRQGRKLNTRLAEQ